MRVLATGIVTVLALGMPGPSLHAGPPAGDACTRKAVRQLVRDFVRAYNAGDLSRLDQIWAEEPHFDWYSVQGERQADAENRATLRTYFAERHLQGDRLRIRSLSIARSENDATWGFAYRLTRMSDQDPAAGRYHGKGSARGPSPLLVPQIQDPTRPDRCLLHVWSMGRDV